MTHHWDFGPDKTKGERRERAKEKERERMSQGKKIKELARLIQKRAEEAEKARKERGSK